MGKWVVPFSVIATGATVLGTSAIAALVKGPVGSASRGDFREVVSPLDYGASARRLALYLPGLPADKGDKYASEVGLAGFIDYTTPWRRGDDVYIRYMYVRPAVRGHGHMRALLDEFYRRHRGASYVDWGEIVSAGAEKLWRQYRARPDGPRTTGKIW